MWICSGKHCRNQLAPLAGAFVFRGFYTLHYARTTVRIMHVYYGGVIMTSKMNWDKNREYRADRKKRSIRVFRNVEILREKANITKTDLAELLDCSQSMYSNWSIGRFVPSDYEAVLNKLSDIFGVSAEKLEDPDFKVDEINTVKIIDTKHEEEVVNTKIEDDENVIFQSAIERKKIEIQNEIKELQLRQQELLEKLKKLEEFEGLMF